MITESKRIESKVSRVRRRLKVSARTNERRVHIIFRPEGWAVKKEGNKIATIVVEDKDQALEIAQDLVKKGQASSVVVHLRDGSIAANGL